MRLWARSAEDIGAIEVLLIDWLTCIQTPVLSFNSVFIMFGLFPNILSLLQFSLVFIPLCPNFVVLFLQEFLCDQLQILAQWSFGSGEVCYDFSKSYTMLFRIYSGFSWSLYGAMSNFDRLFLIEFLSNRHQTLAQWSLCIEVFCYDYVHVGWSPMNGIMIGALCQRWHHWLTFNTWNTYIEWCFMRGQRLRQWPSIEPTLGLWYGQ